MEQVKKLFVNPIQAKKIKELGFSENCFAYFNMINHTEKYKLDSWIWDNTNDYIEAPLKSQVFLWFRENHNLYHEISIDRTSEPKFSFSVFKYSDFGNYEEVRSQELFRRYEEAESACIDALIEILENESKKD